eukprot:Skav225267  [mRNA]  locus=scaffold4099:101810:106312:+ [translate_table: standard]
MSIARRLGATKAKWHSLSEWIAGRGGYVHPALEPSWVSHGGISMMGVVSRALLPEGTVVIELPRSALLDVELLGSLPEDSCSASEFAPYLDLLPSEADLRRSDLYYAGHFSITEPWSLEFLSPAADYVPWALREARFWQVPSPHLVFIAVILSAKGLRAASLKELDVKEVWPVPRCHPDGAQEQAVLRCSLARLAYELCAQAEDGFALCALLLWCAVSAPRTASRFSRLGPALPRKASLPVDIAEPLHEMKNSPRNMVGAKDALRELFARAERGLVAEALVDALLQMAEWLMEDEDLEDLLQ